MFPKHLSNLYHSNERQMHKELMCKHCIQPPVSSAFLACSTISFSNMDLPVHVIEDFFFPSMFGEVSAFMCILHLTPFYIHTVTNYNLKTGCFYYNKKTRGSLLCASLLTILQIHQFFLFPWKKFLLLLLGQFLLCQFSKSFFFASAVLEKSLPLYTIL